MAEGMTGTLNRMMTIARTETLRVYNESSRQQYISSGIVSSYTRIAAHDRRTCLHCIVLEGTVYPTNELMPSHPNCRCTLIPIVNGAPKPEWLKGEDWFMAQPSATQESIMGASRYELWRTGQIGLHDSTQIVPNPVWGDTLRTVPLRELV